MNEAETMITDFMNSGTTSFVVKAQMCASGREREFKFPSSDAPLWILEYAIRAWVLETCEEEEHLFIGVHLMLEERTIIDVYDHRPPESPEKIPLSSIFVNVATDGEYVVKVVLDTERSQDTGALKQKTPHCVSCLLNRMSINQMFTCVFAALCLNLHLLGPKDELCM